MVNISLKKRHQQFGLILLLIVVILGLAFTIWYFSEKKNIVEIEKNNLPVAAERDSNGSVEGRMNN